MDHGPASNANWVYDSPVRSEVEAKLRQFLVELGNADKIIGIQVCAYKDGEVIIDTAAGVLKKDDPQPVQPDSLFNCFSTTKGVAAGMIHWLADKGKLKLDEYVANFWPAFGTNGKDQIKVNHVLNHTSGLHNALAGFWKDPTLFCNYEECLKRLEMATPETEPGRVQLYHYLSFGWICAGIIEHASGKKFHDVLAEAFARPLNIEDEFFIGIPPGVESRLATIEPIDRKELDISFSLVPESARLPSTFTVDTTCCVTEISNSLNGRRAILPASNGHFSARALARYYAALADGGVVPPLEKKDDHSISTKMFSNPKEKIHDAILGRGEYTDLIIPDGLFGLGFRGVKTTDGIVFGFGHAGYGGSTGYCDFINRYAISVTLNKLTLGNLTGEIICFVCSELGLPIPEDYAAAAKGTSDEQPKIN